MQARQQKPLAAADLQNALRGKASRQSRKIAQKVGCPALVFPHARSFFVDVIVDAADRCGVAIARVLAEQDWYPAHFLELRLAFTAKQAGEIRLTIGADEHFASLNFYSSG